MYSSGDISHHFGVVMTVEFITNKLDVPPDDTDKRSTLYNDESYDKIARNLIAHIEKRASVTPPARPKPVKKEKPAAEPASTGSKSFDDEEEL